MRTVILPFVAAIFCLPAATFAQAIESGRATGQLVIGEKTIPLTIAYANAEDDVEGVRRDEPKKSLTILLSAEAVPAAERTDWDALDKRAREGKLHAIQLQYDPAKNEVYMGTIFYKMSGVKDGPLKIAFNGNTNYRFENFSVKEGAISGAAQVVEPRDWVDSGADAAKYSYSVSFNAWIVQPTPVTATLTGKEAQASPQVALGTRFFKACYAGDIDTIRRISIPAPEMDEYIKKEGIAKAKEFLRIFAPPPAEFAKMSKRVIVRGETATMVAGEDSTGFSAISLKMTRKNGKWIITK